MMRSLLYYNAGWDWSLSSRSNPEQKSCWKHRTCLLSQLSWTLSLFFLRPAISLCFSRFFSVGLPPSLSVISDDFCAKYREEKSELETWMRSRPYYRVDPGSPFITIWSFVPSPYTAFSIGTLFVVWAFWKRGLGLVIHSFLMKALCGWVWPPDGVTFPFSATLCLNVMLRSRNWACFLQDLHSVWSGLERSVGSIEIEIYCRK